MNRGIVVIPTYNEAENLPLIVPKVLEQDPRLEILVVDDNSPDGTGLQVDFTPADKFRKFPPLGWLLWGRRKLLGDHALLGHYRKHPDANQEGYFFGLLRECVDAGMVSPEFIAEQIERKHVRSDAERVMNQAPGTDLILSGLPSAS